MSLVANILDQVPDTDRHLGYLVDVSDIKLEDSADGETSTSWVHAMSLGTYKHPLYGTLEFTPERIQRFAANVKNKIRGIDPAIDYSHKSEDKAAGWVKDAEARPNGLWILVEWTKSAAEAIRNKEFRYFSPDYADAWEDASGTKHRDVLMGGGLTNRPFLKNLLPVNLSEFNTDPERKEKESMELNDILQALGLSEDATEQDALDAIKKLQETPPAPSDPPQVDPDLEKLLAENPQVKSLVDKVAELEAANRLSEATRLAESWTTNVPQGRKFALPPAVSEQLTEVLVASPQLHEKLSEIFDHLTEHGVVKLTEDGRITPKDDEERKTASDLVMEETRKLMEADKALSFTDAYAKVLSDDPDLYARYRADSFAGALAEEVTE